MAMWLRLLVSPYLNYLIISLRALSLSLSRGTFETSQVLLVGCQVVMHWVTYSNIDADKVNLGERTGLVVRASDSGSGDPGSILGRVGVLFP